MDRRPRPCLENLDIYDCGDLVTLLNLPSSLKHLSISHCSKLCSVSGQLDGLQTLYIYGCSKLQSLNSMGDLPSVETLSLYCCPCLASLPGVLGTYSALQNLTISHCPAIDLKPLDYKRHQQQLDCLDYKHLSHAHSSIPGEGTTFQRPFSIPFSNHFACPLCCKSTPCKFESAFNVRDSYTILHFQGPI